MSQFEKLRARFLSKPKDFTWTELVQLLRNLRFHEVKGGHSGGSRRKFLNPKLGLKILVHKPHPYEILKPYQ